MGIVYIEFLFFMSYTNTLCTPALIYILFSVAQIMIDIFQGMFNTAFVKFCIALMITLLLHYLCVSGYKVVSWIIVFIPFILMTVITYILLISLGMDPYKGKLNIIDPNQKFEITTDIRQQYTQMYGSSDNTTSAQVSSLSDSSIGDANENTNSVEPTESPEPVSPNEEVETFGSFL